MAQADRRIVGIFDIKEITFSYDEIPFRVDILKQTGFISSKNISDILFVTMHEMTHLAQSIFANDIYKKSKQLQYKDRPTEIHADKVALKFCKLLLQFYKNSEIDSNEKEIMIAGLKKTIDDADTTGRPRT